MPKAIHEALEEYQQVRGREAANIRSLIKLHLLSQVLPILGLQSLQHKPVPYIFDQIPINGFIGIAEPIFQQQLPLVENPNTRKVMKSQWKRFCQWLREQAWYCDERPQLQASVEDSTPPFTHLPRGASYQPRQLRKQGWDYGLKKAELTPKLKQQLQDFHKFCQTITRDRQQGNREVSQQHYQYMIFHFLGWLKNVEGVPVEDLDLRNMTDLSLLKRYEHWNEQRRMSSSTLWNYLQPCIPVAKFFLSQSCTGEELEKKIKPFREFVNAIPDRKDRPNVSDTAYRERELSKQDCETIVRYLEWRCKDLQQQQGVTDKVIDAWMDYLIIALFATTSVRQREVRELSIQRLNLHPDGTYFVQLKPEDHKNGSKTGRGRGYPLFVSPFQKQLSADLTYYLEQIRPNQQLDHDCLFFIRSTSTRGTIHRFRGDRIVDSSCLGGWVTRLIYKVTAHLFGAENAKRTTCHDFRRITATWVCTYGNPAHFPLYAEMLGHSAEMLRDLYARTYPGALAAQVPLAYEEIVENENRVTQRLGTNVFAEHGATPQPSVTSANEQVELMRSMLKMFWMALPKSKRNEMLQVLSPAQRQLLGM